MALRSNIRDAQRSIAALDAAHARTTAAFEAAVARRADVLAEEDRRVAAARERVERTVADMARQLSPALTSRLLDVALAEVRRITRAHPADDEQ
jgi:hypothetical protein